MWKLIRPCQNATFHMCRAYRKLARTIYPPHWPLKFNAKEMRRLNRA